MLGSAAVQDKGTGICLSNKYGGQGTDGAYQVEHAQCNLAVAWGGCVETNCFTCAGDEGLYRDLLRKAHGDEHLARKWLTIICGHGSEGPSDLIAAASKLLRVLS